MLQQVDLTDYNYHIPQLMSYHLCHFSMSTKGSSPWNASTQQDESHDDMRKRIRSNRDTVVGEVNSLTCKCVTSFTHKGRAIALVVLS